MDKNINKAIEYIKSKEYIDSVSLNLKWCEHGSLIKEYFEDEDLMFEYSNNILRKKEIKKYIEKKLPQILNDIKSEQKKFLYRTIYAKETPRNEGFYGYYWSSREDTNACVELRSEQEYLLITKFKDEKINWIETIKSRLDFCYGDNEKEYYLKESNIVLENVIEL